jgi:hypothetical protein
MFYTLINNIFNFFNNKNNISCSTSLTNLLDIENKYIQDLKSKYPSLHFIKNIQMFIIDINKKYYINVKSHSLMIFPKQSTNHILFIQGNSIGSSIWFDKGAKLAEKGYIVHCISLPAFGASTVSKKILDFNPNEILIFYSNYIAEYIINNIGKNNPPQIIGNAFGTFVISFFALKYPHLCKTITHVNENIINRLCKKIVFNVDFSNYVKKIGYIINYFYFTYYKFKNETNLLYYMNIVEMTSRDIFGELVISKITNYKPEPISFLYDKKDKLILFHCNENLSVFYNENNENNENNEIIKIKTENKSNCDIFFDDLLEIIKK